MTLSHETKSVIPLYRRLHIACSGLYLVSQGTTQNFNARTTGTKEHHGPSGEGRPAYELFQKRWNDGERTEALVLEAEDELRNWKRQPEPEDREYEYGSLAWKRKIARDDRGASEVARVFMVSRQTVYNYRSQFGE